VSELQEKGERKEESRKISNPTVTQESEESLSTLKIGLCLSQKKKKTEKREERKNMGGGKGVKSQSGMITGEEGNGGGLLLQ